MISWNLIVDTFFCTKIKKFTMDNFFSLDTYSDPMCSFTSFMWWTSNAAGQNVCSHANKNNCNVSFLNFWLPMKSYRNENCESCIAVLFYFESLMNISRSCWEDSNQTFFLGPRKKRLTNFVLKLSGFNKLRQIQSVQSDIFWPKMSTMNIFIISSSNTNGILGNLSKTF